MLADSMATYRVKHHSDHQAAAWTHCYLFTVPEVINRDFEAVATGARIMVDLEGLVVRHVLDLDLIIDGKLLVVRHGFKSPVVGVNVSS